MENNNKNRLVLLDTSAIMFRAYYANMNFRSKSGPTGAVYGFVNVLGSIIRELKPTHMVAAFDIKRTELIRRHEYEGYKADRENVPEDLLVQIPKIEELLDCYGIKRVSYPGYEADDVLGTIASHVGSPECDAIVVTGDKDLAQIVAPNVQIALLGKGASSGDNFGHITNDDDVVKFLGVKASQIPNLFGLIGDSSDGIPGVRGVGEKKALPMLEKYGDLEGVYEHIDELSSIPGIGPKLIQTIKDNKDMAFLSRKLATINKDLDIDCNLDNFTFGIDNDRLVKLYTELEFKSFLKKMGEVASSENHSGDTEYPKDLFSSNPVENTEITDKENANNISKEQPKPIKSQFILIDTEVEFRNKLMTIAEGSPVAMLYDNAGIALSYDDIDVYLPLCHRSLMHRNIDSSLIHELLSLPLDFVVYDAKTFIKNGYNICRDNLVMDMMIAHHLCTSSTRGDIDKVVNTLYDMPLTEYKEVFGKTESVDIEPQQLGEYLTKRSRGLLTLYPQMKDEIATQGLMDIWKDIEKPLIYVLAQMEVEGIAIAPQHFVKYAAELQQKISENEAKIHELAQEKFNVNSPKQLSEVLFMKLNLAPIKKTKSGLSTNVEVLEELSDRGVEIAKYILEYRKLNKLMSTYVDVLPRLVDSHSRVHTTFNQTGTATGRLSSSDPNLQNIPVKTDEGMKIREGFVAKGGYTLLGVDYSQIELRVLAELSQDETLVSAYRDNLDLHENTARRLFGKTNGEDITRQERALAKIINFSIIYGKTAYGLSKELKITPSEATDYINKYFDTYPKVRAFEHEIISFAEKHGYTETYMHRRRLIEGIKSTNKNIKSQAERMAVNSVIQGTAAEIIKKAMIDIYTKIKDNSDIRLLLQVHDELIFEIADGKIDTYRHMIQDIMEHCIDFTSVPLKVNINVGKNWSLLK